jgi:DNA-binding FadR family transcriptional regulator
MVSGERPPQRAATIRPRSRAGGAHGAVLKGIGMAIVSGEFPGGSALPGKDALMQRFGVSNTPLREALQALASKGLIAARTKVGTWVRDEADWNMFDPDILGWRLEAGIDDAFLARLFEMRQAFEPVAAAIAAQRRSATQLAGLEAVLAEMSQAKRDKQRFTDADLALHIGVLQASGNPFMRSIGALIHTALAASFASSAPTDDPARADFAVGQHGALVEAIARRDAQGSADAMMEVIRHGWANIGAGHSAILATLSITAFSPPSRPDDAERNAADAIVAI